MVPKEAMGRGEWNKSLANESSMAITLNILSCPSTGPSSPSQMKRNAQLEPASVASRYPANRLRRHLNRVKERQRSLSSWTRRWSDGAR
jgi:hypothetical protein